MQKIFIGIITSLIPLLGLAQTQGGGHYWKMHQATTPYGYVADVTPIERSQGIAQGKVIWVLPGLDFALPQSKIKLPIIYFFDSETKILNERGAYTACVLYPKQNTYQCAIADLMHQTSSQGSIEPIVPNTIVWEISQDMLHDQLTSGVTNDNYTSLAAQEFVSALRRAQGQAR